MLIILAGFGARTAAFSFNRIIDRHIDRLNPRTSARELPAGKMSLSEAWGVALFGAGIYILAAWKIAPEDVAQVVMDILSMPERTLISRIEMRPSKPAK